MRRALVLLACAGLAGCDDPLTAVELISDARVLGARVEVLDDPGRAAPAPGESAAVTFLVASPELSPELGYALAVCPAEPGGAGRAACAGEPFASVASPAAVAEPRLSFEVPAELEPAGRLTVLGIVCPGGSPSADGASCDGADPGTPVSLELELAHEDDVNTNPELEDDALSFDGEPWAELPAVDGECAGLGFIEVAAGSKHALEIRLDEADRDVLPQEEDQDPPRESLQLSHFTTDGDLARAFSSIAFDDVALARSVAWTAPKQLAQSQLTRLWFVVRDLRGGSDFTERAVCVLP